MLQTNKEYCRSLTREVKIKNHMLKPFPLLFIAKAETIIEMLPNIKGMREEIFLPFFFLSPVQARTWMVPNLCQALTAAQPATSWEEAVKVSEYRHGRWGPAR